MTQVSATDPSRPTSRRDLLREIARRLRDPTISTGALASLRRGTPQDVARQAAFHRLLAEIPDQHTQADDLIRWASVVQCMSLTRVAGAPFESDGTLLARAGLSESRFARLLASRGDGLRDQMLLVARYLRSKDTSPVWADLGELALTDGLNEERADALRLRLARDYYRALTSGHAV